MDDSLRFEIPDRDPAMTTDSSLSLADILPDWGGDERFRLLTRPIFEPSLLLGRARFHNDNDGTVRSFLAARWLVGLREANLRTSSLFRLLFANSYGLEVIKPSINETVAWLCAWDRDVANEVIRRGPALLLSAGDPASLSVGVRSAALTGLLREATAEDQEWPWWDNDKLRRFAQSDLGNTVLALWPQYRGHKEAARLLMRLSWLGALKECEPLARDLAFDVEAEPLLRVIAGKALLAVADPSTRTNYAAMVLAKAASLPVRMVRDAVLELSPKSLSVQETLRILSHLDLANDRDGLDFEHDGVILAKKLEVAVEIEAFLVGLLGQLDGRLEENAYHRPTKKEEALFPAMAESVIRLLKRSPVDQVPDAAIDAMARISNRRELPSKLRETTSEALTELHRTAGRRRNAFWRVVAAVRQASSKRPVDQLWHVEFLGYPAGLKVEDVDWLLDDALAKGGVDCRLAVSAALAIYRSHGQPPAVYEKICRLAEMDSIAREVYREWNTPRVSADWELESERKLLEIDAQNKAAVEKRDQYWIGFIRDIRSDPGRIAKLRLPIQVGRRSDLMDLWRLLHGAGSQSRYAIDSVAPLERIAGVEVASAVADGLMALWRTCSPLVRSRRDAHDRNSLRWIDLMGLAGVTLEAAKNPLWATTLSVEEARLAAEFSLIEINGFPRWLYGLVNSRPAEVSAVLHHEINDELTREGVALFETLNAVTYSHDHLAQLVAPALLQDLEDGLSVPPGAVLPVLQILVSGLVESKRARFEKLAISMFERGGDEANTSVPYLAAAFAINPVAATASLVERANTLEEAARTKLVDWFLAACFGDSMSNGGFKTLVEPPPKVIEELMLLSFKTHKQVAARRRAAGVVYQPNDDDYADQARSAVFSRFVQTPGSATYHALVRLQQDSTFPVPPVRLRALAEQRALEDSESAPWPPVEAYAFEKCAETSPRTGMDLRAVVLGRIEDMQHELLHDDFSQGQTLQGLKPEREVQKWVADRLRLKQGRSYSVEREPHVVDEKEPDVRVRSKATDAHVAVEVKVADSWTLADLDDALEVQLCGKYLREDQGRYGILLLVHQIARPLGWEDKTNDTYLAFADVVARLRARVLVISGEHHNAPQAEVAILDVSTC
ncbi:MAG: hypothetical protein QM757_11380 [Paludibaculum sp.]